MSEPNEPGMVADVDEEPIEQDDAEYAQHSIEHLGSLIRKYQDEATANLENPDVLSRAILNLARVNSALGRHAAYAKYLARNADRAARRFRAEKTLGYAEDRAVNKSELQAELDAKNDFLTASEAQLIADRADDLCYRTDTFLKLAQSRLSLIKNDIHR